ncbi:MAG: glutathione peroxidase [Planctomycetota bacterium]
MKNTPQEKNATPKEKTIYDFILKDIDGKEVNMSEYKGKVLLLVNVASKCGYTSQYEGLQKLYLKYKDKNFVILGFPANNFLSQEPGSDSEIKTFCSTKYNVTFPLFSKISVQGADKHPFYQFLTEKQTNPEYAGDIKWNFNKFLVNKEGKIVGRFDSSVKPESTILTESVENALK